MGIFDVFKKKTEIIPEKNQEEKEVEKQKEIVQDIKFPPEKNQEEKIKEQREDQEALKNTKELFEKIDLADIENVHDISKNEIYKNEILPISKKCNDLSKKVVDILDLIEKEKEKISKINEEIEGGRLTQDQVIQKEKEREKIEEQIDVLKQQRKEKSEQANEDREKVEKIESEKTKEILEENIKKLEHLKLFLEKTNIDITQIPVDKNKSIEEQNKEKAFGFEKIITLSKECSAESSFIYEQNKSAKKYLENISSQEIMQERNEKIKALEKIELLLDEIAKLAQEKILEQVKKEVGWSSKRVEYVRKNTPSTEDVKNDFSKQVEALKNEEIYEKEQKEFEIYRPEKEDVKKLIELLISERDPYNISEKTAKSLSNILEIIKEARPYSSYSFGNKPKAFFKRTEKESIKNLGAQLFEVSIMNEDPMQKPIERLQFYSKFNL